MTMLMTIVTYPISLAYLWLTGFGFWLMTRDSVKRGRAAWLTWFAVWIAIAPLFLVPLIWESGPNMDVPIMFLPFVIWLLPSAWMVGKRMPKKQLPLGGWDVRHRGSL